MLKITLKSARVNAGFTQKEVEKRLAVSNKTISNWENGISFPKIDKVNALCKLYNISYDNIIFLPNNSL